jgi:hypothetical protein
MKVARHYCRRDLARGSWHGHGRAFVRAHWRGPFEASEARWSAIFGFFISLPDTGVKGAVGV